MMKLTWPYLPCTTTPRLPGCVALGRLRQRGGYGGVHLGFLEVGALGRPGQELKRRDG